MARVRAISIRNFRGIAKLDWLPSSGMNCLIGPGDSGKSTILDAIDFCVGARRNAVFSDADFHALDTSRLLQVVVTIGELPDAMRSMEAYSSFLRGFDPVGRVIADEPGLGHETVLTLVLAVGADLEPAWSLYSDRSAAQGSTRSLAWGDRVSLSPTRIGGSGSAHLGWRRGSVLKRLSDDSPDATATLVAAARQARETFGTSAEAQLASTLAVVDRVASSLGVPLQGGSRAFLDAGSISFSGGTVALHDGRGVPLIAMGTGSARLLVAGLQREAASKANIALVDELEHGLEPHRVIGFLNSLGAKETEPPLQIFCTTHSPAAVRELASEQISLVRLMGDGSHRVGRVSDAGDVQGVLRAYPEAFLAIKVIVCEGASEVGLLRGIDRHLTQAFGYQPLSAKGIALVDAGGADKLYGRANSFIALRYATAVFRDDDVQPTPGEEAAFLASGGMLTKWRTGRALEDELFASLPNEAVWALLDLAVDNLGSTLIEAHLRTASQDAMGLADRAALAEFVNRPLLAAAAKTRRMGWFKSVSRMEEVGCTVVGPSLHACDPEFARILSELYDWTVR